MKKIQVTIITVLLFALVGLAILIVGEYKKIVSSTKEQSLSAVMLEEDSTEPLIQKASIAMVGDILLYE